MRLLLIICIFLSTNVDLKAQCEPTSSEVCIILLRHAEKLNDGTSDPTLSERGIERAENLMTLLSDTEISAILSTDFDRTKSTVKPLADSKDLEIQIYDFMKLNEYIPDWIEQYKGATIVIVGHSNTTPYLTNALLKENTVSKMTEDDYGDLYYVIIDESSGTRKLVTGSFR